MAFNTRRIERLESTVAAQAAEIAALKAAQGPALAAPVTRPAAASDVAALRETVEAMSRVQAELRGQIEAERTAHEAAPAPVKQRTPLEAAMALEDARQAPIAVDRAQVASILGVLARANWGTESIYRIAGTTGEFVDSVAMVRVLDAAGLIELKHARRADTRVELTDAGRLVAEQLLGLTIKFTPPASKPATVVAEAPEAPATEPPAPEAATAEAPVAAPLARALAALGAIDVVRVRGSAVDPDICRRVLDAVLVYSDQPLDAVAKRNGIPLFEVAEAARVLRDAGLMVIANGKRLRPSTEGRTFGMALRAYAAAAQPSTPDREVA